MQQISEGREVLSRRGAVAGGLVLVLSAVSAAGCASSRSPSSEPVASDASGRAAEGRGERERAIFAGGCFWCVEAAFEGLPGVIAVVSGFSGGPERSPTYEQVSSGTTGHLEAVEVTFDPRRIRYEGLLYVFWRQIDPTDGGGQFADRGPQYGTAIFVNGEVQRAAAEASRDELEASGVFSEPIVTEVRAAGPFWPAEAYHQDYSRTSPVRYAAYHAGSGRERFLDRVWGEAPHGLGIARAAFFRTFVTPTDAELRERLTDLQYRVVRGGATEPPFANEYWNDHRPGLYVDAVTGEPLFSSRDKFDSGTGWPSFQRPVEDGAVEERTDRSLGMARTEVRSRLGASHLGHVFDDGPPPTGRRYCINSAALELIPADQLVAQGYGEYAHRVAGE